MSNNELARQILDLVGGVHNVVSVTHCVTRLRFVLKDESKAKTEEIQKLDVIGVQQQGGQYQVIIGSKVGKVYLELEKMLPEKITQSGSPAETGKKKGIFSMLLDTLSSILAAVIAPVIGGGMLKGILFFFTNYSLLSTESSIYIVLNIASDCMFYFLPFLLAVSAARKFKTNEYMALALAATLLYPTITAGAAAGTAPIELFGVIQLPYIDYKSTVIPIILAVWVMKYVYRFFEKHIPDVVSTIFTPLLTLVIMVPVMLTVIAPLGYYGGNYLSYGVDFLVEASPVISGFVIAALRPILVFTGMHHATRPIIYQQIATNGYTTVSPANFLSTFAQATACLGMYFATKKSSTKRIAMSTSISGFLGVTEPGLYGIIMKYKAALVGTIVGGGLGGMVCTAMGAKAYSSSMPSILTIPVYAGGGYPSIILGLLVTLAGTFVITYLLAKTVFKETEQEEAAQVQEKQNTVKELIVSPVCGETLPLTEVEDQVFSSGLVGKGIAVIPENGEVKAPVSGRIKTLPDTKHAVGIETDRGMELLIHVGLDTCKLEGRHFDAFYKEGDYVKKGELLLRFDKESIEKEGYNPVTLVIVTNSDSFHIETKAGGERADLDTPVITAEM